MTHETPEPPNRNRDARLYMLGMWVISLVPVALFPYLGLEGQLLLVMSLVMLAATLITSFLVVFAFNRYWDRPDVFAVGVALSAVAFGAMNALNALTQAIQPQPRPIESIVSLVTLLLIDLLWMTLLVSVLIMWRGKGGLPMLVFGSLAALWTPLIFAWLYSVDAFINTLFGIGTNGQAQTGPINLIFCSALCAVPIAGIAILARLLRGLVRDLSG